MSGSFIRNYQYPDLKSRLEKYLAPDKRSINSYVRGKGYLSLTVTLFRPRKSIQKRILPSGFLTNNTGLAQGEFDGSIMPAFNRASTSCLIIFASYGPVLYGALCYGLVPGSRVIVWTSSKPRVGGT